MAANGASPADPQPASEPGAAGSGAGPAPEERPTQIEAWPGEPAEAQPPGAGGAEDTWFRRARLSFRQWRRTRPFWAGLLCLLGGALIAFGPLSVFRYVLVAGTVIWAGVLMGLLVCAMGLFMWFTPQFRQIVGVLAAIFSVVSLITSNLGGFVIGMLLGTLGGAMGFAWTPIPAQGARAEARPGAPAPRDETPARREQRGGQDAPDADPGAPARAAATAPLPRQALPGH